MRAWVIALVLSGLFGLNSWADMPSGDPSAIEKHTYFFPATFWNLPSQDPAKTFTDFSNKFAATVLPLFSLGYANWNGWGSAENPPGHAKVGLWFVAEPTDTSKIATFEAEMTRVKATPIMGLKIPYPRVLKITPHLTMVVRDRNGKETPVKFNLPGRTSSWLDISLRTTGADIFNAPDTAKFQKALKAVTPVAIWPTLKRKLATADSIEANTWGLIELNSGSSFDQVLEQDSQPSFSRVCATQGC